MGLLDLFSGGNSSGLYGDALTPDQQQAINGRGLLGFLGGLAKSGALDYTMPTITGQLPGGFAKGLAGGMAGSAQAQDAAAETALKGGLLGLQGQQLKSQIQGRSEIDKAIGPLMQMLFGGQSAQSAAAPASAAPASDTAGDTVERPALPIAAPTMAGTNLGVGGATSGGATGWPFPALPATAQFPNLPGNPTGGVVDKFPPVSTLPPDAYGPGSPFGRTPPAAGAASAPVNRPPLTGAGGLQPGGGIDPRALALAALGVKAGAYGLPDIMKPLENAYYNSAGQKGAVAGAEQTERNRSDLTFKPEIAGRTKAAELPSVNAAEGYKAEQQRITEGAKPMEVGPDKDIVYPPGSPGAASYRNAQMRGEKPDNVTLLPNGGVRVTGGNAGTFGKEVAQLNAKQLLERRAVALDAQKSLENTAETRELLNGMGDLPGSGASWKLAFRKAGTALGYPDDKVTNTEAFVSTRAAEVGRLIKQFGSGTGLSDADRAYATKMAAGDIALNKESITRILDITERASRNIITEHNKEASKIPPGLSPYPLTVDMPAAPAAAQPRRGAYNPTTGQIEWAK